MCLIKCNRRKVDGTHIDYARSSRMGRLRAGPDSRNRFSDLWFRVRSKFCRTFIPRVGIHKVRRCRTECRLLLHGKPATNAKPAPASVEGGKEMSDCDNSGHQQWTLSGVFQQPQPEADNFMTLASRHHGYRLNDSFMSEIHSKHYILKIV